MGLSESLGNVYMKVEDTYYGVLDFFEEKGIGIPWAYNDFLETKGIPALPFTAALLLVILGGIFWVGTSNQASDVSFTLSMKDDKGDPLYDVSVRVLDDQGNVLLETTASHGQTITLSGIKPNTSLVVEAHKEGFGTQSVSVFSSDDKIVLLLEGDNDAVVGKLKLVDAETLTTITEATVSAEWSAGDTSIIATPEEDGIISLNVPLNQEISITVKSPNYEDLYDTIVFSGGDVKIKELTPKPGTTSGPSILLVKTIDGKTQLPIADVHIKIDNVQTGETISDLDSSTGLHSENLSKGMVVRVTVTKDGFLTYSSNADYPGGKTLRNEEETIIAPLTDGGTTLYVVAQNQANQQPLQGVDVVLLDSLYETIETQTTTFSGDAQFGGLNQTNAYYLLAFHPNFFPERLSVDWPNLDAGENGKSLILGLSPFTSGTAGILTVFVNEEGGKIATETSVWVDEQVNGTFIPLVGKHAVDNVGSFSVRLPVGTVIRVTAEKDDASASANQEVTIVQGLNKMTLDLDNVAGMVTFNLTYANGQLFSGKLRVEDTGKGVLFDNTVTNGKVDVAVGQADVVHLTATDEAGKKYTQTVTIAGKDSVDVVLDAVPAANGGAPEVSFLGLFNASGELVPGFAPETETFARFSVKWPASATSGGLLVRVGSDSVFSSDSQYLGIVGINADASNVAYGKTWTPSPKPGNETKDRKSGVGPGTFSKWIEVTTQSPSGVSTFDVQIKAKKGIPTGTQEIHYRSFVTIGNQIIRSPVDSELGFAAYTPTKSGLYASVQTATIPVYESIPLCQNGICVSISLLDKNNRAYSIGNAQAMVGEPYAVEVTILPGLVKNNVNTGTPTASTSTGEGLVPFSALGGTGASTSSGAAGFQNPGYTLKAQTNAEEPLLVFTKAEVNTFGKLADTGKKDTSITTPIPPSLAGNPSRARVHFLPEQTGQSYIEVQITTSSSVWNQTISLEIVDPRFLEVIFPNKVGVGETIPVQVNDDQGNPIEGAQITLTKSDGTVAASLKGKGLPSKGENGNYVIDKSLAAGLYGIRVQVPAFMDFEDSIAVGIDSPLQLPEKIEIAIPVGQTKVTQNVLVVNKTGAALTNLTGELSPFENFPSSFVLEVGTVPSIPANGKANLAVTVTYTGSPEDTEVKIGVGQLRVHGDASQKFPVESATQLSVIYNKQLDPSCLKFNKDKLTVTLMGDAQPYGSLYGNNYSGLNNGLNDDYYGNNLINDSSSYYGFNNAQYDTGLYNSSGYNNYGYNSSGYYQNAENKRVSVKAKNECGEELLLIPGITTADGQIEVDGLRVAAVDSSFKLLKGQEKQVDFTVTNDLFRAGGGLGYAGGLYGGGLGGGLLGGGLYGSGGLYGGAGLGLGTAYQVNFRAAQLSASLPLQIQFFDRSRALLAPPSVELNLIKSGTQKATDRVVVPITNIGAGPIYDIRVQILGEKPADITTKLENSFGGSFQGAHSNYTSAYTGYSSGGYDYGGGAGAYSSGYGNSLQPGQTLSPPIAIVGETSSDEQALTTQQLQITGLVEGKRSVLRTVDVFIRTGGTSCLEISAFDTPISFISSEVTGTLSKRVTVRNKCLEPVQITTVNPENVNGNTLSFTTAGSSSIVEKDAEEEFNLILSKANTAKSQLSITVKGIMILSQKGVESNALPVEIALGENELEHTNTSNGIEVNVCEGGTTTIRFPLVAKKSECSQAYCDAEQASNMLSTLIEQQIAKAVQVMQSKKNDASQFSSCDITKRYCTFSQLGIKSPSMDLFLQNDNLTPEMLEFVMRDGTYPRLTRMQAEGMSSLAGEGADDSFAQRLGTGLGNKILMAPIQGCGRYTLSIIGGVEIVTNQLQSDDGISMGIKVTSEQKTAECQDKIYNAANFLPKDRSLTIQNSHQTLMGVVKYTGNDLQDPAKWLAQEVYGSDSRAVTNTGSNHLDLRVGNLSQSIVELSLDPSTSGSVPKRIIATVRKTQGKVEKEAVVEAGKIITSLGQNVNGCITKDEQTWRIVSVKDVGQFTYEGCMLDGTAEGGLVVRPVLSCCVLQAKSDIQSNTTFDLTPNGANALAGVSSLDLYEKNTQTTASNPTPGTKMTVGAEYPLVFDTKNQVYMKEVLLCGLTDAATQAQANKATVQTSATRILDGSKAGPRTFELRTCTLDVDDALSKAYKNENGVWYATVDWTDNVSTKTIKQVVDEAVIGKKMENAFFSFQDQEIRAIDNPVYKEKYREQEVEALGKFALACGATCGACQVGLGLVSLGAGALASGWDCFISCGAGTVAGGYEIYKDKAEDTFLEKPVDFVEGTYGDYVRDPIVDTLTDGGESEPGAGAAVGGIAATSLKTIRSPLGIVYKDDKGKLINRLTPEGVGGVKTADLAFLDDAKTAIEAQATKNFEAVMKYNGEFKTIPAVPAVPPTATSPGFPGTPATHSDPTPGDAAIARSQLRGYDDIKSGLNDGFDKLIAKYKKVPGFKEADYLAWKASMTAPLDNATRYVNGLSASFTPGATPAAIPYNTFLEDKVKTELGKTTGKTMGASSKLQITHKAANFGKATAGVARSLVCGGTGNVVGYLAYNDAISEEIENKIVLNEGSSNVIDPTTNELTFHKGLTYAFTVGPEEGKGRSRKISIDVVSPTATVAGDRWLDGACTGK